VVLEWTVALVKDLGVDELAGLEVEEHGDQVATLAFAHYKARVRVRESRVRDNLSRER